MPLEKKYIISHGNQCRLTKGKIVDPGLIEKVRMENIKDVNRKQERYFELLREWKGYLMVCIDITDEFDQFQERIKTKYIEFHHNDQQMNKNQSISDDTKDRDKETKNENQQQNNVAMNQIDWDNRKYFLNNDEMPHLTHDEQEDRVTCGTYVLLDSKRVYNFNEKFNFFDTLTQKEEQSVLTNIFAFVGVREDFDNTLPLVCAAWHRFDQNWVPQ